MSSITATDPPPKLPSNIRFDSTYAKSIYGIIQIAEIIMCLIGFICVQTIPHANQSSSGGWYIFAVQTGFWVPLIIFIGYSFHIIEKLHFIPWVPVEMGFSAIMAVLVFIAACVVGARIGEKVAWGAAAFFGYVAVALFGYEAVIKYAIWRARGNTKNQQTTDTTQDEQASNITEDEQSVTNDIKNTPTQTGPN